MFKVPWIYVRCHHVIFFFIVFHRDVFNLCAVDVVASHECLMWVWNCSQQYSQENVRCLWWMLRKPLKPTRIHTDGSFSCATINLESLQTREFRCNCRLVSISKPTYQKQICDKLFIALNPMILKFMLIVRVLGLAGCYGTIGKEVASVETHSGNTQLFMRNNDIVYWLSLELEWHHRQPKDSTILLSYMVPLFSSTVFATLC